MPDFQIEVIRHTEKQENTAHSKKQYKSPDILLEKTQTLDLLGKDLKPAFLNMLKELKEWEERKIGPQWEDRRLISPHKHN